MTFSSSKVQSFQTERSFHTVWSHLFEMEIHMCCERICRGQVKIDYWAKSGLVFEAESLMLYKMLVEG